MTELPRTAPARALTLAEKARLTTGRDTWTTTAVPAAGVPSVRMSDGPHGLRAQRGDTDSLGLHSSEPATCFPPAVALGCTWDPALIERVGAAIAQEARALGIDVVLGPGVNIKRTPLCGRNFEYFSEDPLVAAEAGAATVRGLQGAGVGASLKHFAANNQETDRLRVSADVDERPLREIYLRAFERVVRAERPWTVMASYNAVNGVPVTEHAGLLTGVLREEWGYEGVVVSDWGAVKDRVAALRAGLDLQMPQNQGRGSAAVLAAVEGGELDEAVLDRSVGRLLALARLAAGERPADAAAPAHEAHHALAREAAGRGAVLLKNEGGLLPLDLTAGTVAVVGELARTPRFQGGGSSQVTPVRLDAALESLTAAVRGSGRVVFAPGYLLEGPRAALPGGDGGTASADDLAAEAVAAARAADTVVVFLGLPAHEESEGYDREHLDLPAAQTALLDAVLAVNERVVVVLSNGGVVSVSGWADRVPAIVEGWLLGQAGGSATADVLTGAVNPSGKLTETVPVRLEDVPAHLGFPGEEGRVRYGEGVFVGYRGFDARRLPVAFPFGHGLSYTTFRYENLAVVPEAGEDGGTAVLRICVEVVNTGARRGREVVQFYSAGPEPSAVARPPRELRAFGEVTLDPGERGTVEVRLPLRDLAYWSVRAQGWRLEGGDYRIEAAASSRDIRLSATVPVQGDPDTTALDGQSSLAEWLAHPVGGPLLTRAFAAAGQGGTQDARLLDDPAVMRIALQMPMAAIAEFPGASLDTDGLAHLITLTAAGGADA